MKRQRTFACLILVEFISVTRVLIIQFLFLILGAFGIVLFVACIRADNQCDRKADHLVCRGSKFVLMCAHLQHDRRSNGRWNHQCTSSPTVERETTGCSRSSDDGWLYGQKCQHVVAAQLRGKIKSDDLLSSSLHMQKLFTSWDRGGVSSGHCKQCAHARVQNNAGELACRGCGHRTDND